MYEEVGLCNSLLKLERKNHSSFELYNSFMMLATPADDEVELTVLPY